MKRNKIFKFISYSVLIVYISIMFYYAIVPFNVPVTFAFDSKRLLYHFAEHFIFGILLLNATRDTSRSLKFGLVYSILVELIQLIAPTRVFDFYDLGANILGLLLGMFTFSKVRARF